jgi:glycosyltransferase involved in cell wall biosynthesis
MRPQGEMAARIVNVITRLIVGGPQQVSLLAGDYYRAVPGVEYHLVAGPGIGPEGDYHREAAQLSYHPMPELVRELAPATDLRALWRLVALFRRLRPDLVHARSAKARFLGPLAARIARVPVVVQTVHGWSFNNAVDSRKPIFVGLEKLARSLCDTTVLVSERDREEGAALNLLPPDGEDRLAIIRSGVDLSSMVRSTDDERARFRQALGVTPEQPVLTLAQRMSEPKTPLVFVEAFRAVLAARPDARAWIAGDGPLGDSVRQAVAQAGLTERVRFLGLRKDMAAVISASDLVVHSSLREGLPRVVLEALAIGTPLVATDVGGVSDVVKDGVNGLLVPSNDVPALSGALLRALADPEATRRRVELGRAAVHPFSARKMLDDQHALYRRLLARKGITLPDRAN